MALLSYLNNAATALKPAATSTTTMPKPPARADKKKQETTQLIPAVAEGGGVMVSDFEDVMFRYFGKDSLVIPIGCFVTTVVLATSFYQLHIGNKRNGQLFMRARVAAQGLTVAAMMASLAVQARQKHLGLI
uniref:HIG1 domain-containing protein n=1 Tax=Hemiselmis andersenii TaxID=464988 RepID=A0A6U2CQH3_HEMAN|mmetsp:Transcript_20379/g.47068  ORF Transcript_20379/g.47068 Transcript_20379/m.47068 type:complete len:132 (-) Transcript_20379:183-578(-)|eukprot:CAMPEP_0114149148 /NCGR_PEP_ID=MMETSP0043_2-20121206/22002_1 /TAXON_ID=464988 /ORGANISM="Hemiselmis andersenii, Strain CCMP644" /LENGTH=131 /DNA_ID=CAMNT_0001243767 /DNA_START=115 /DNA_END=510 /DNA_ORIENTATION=-